MIKRTLHNTIVESLRQFPAVGLIGARQVGKTTLAKMIAREWPSESIYLDLEKPSDYAVLAEPERLLSRLSDRLVILDEIQIRGELFPILRSMIDQNRRSGRFLILGSSSPDLLRQSGESLAGRIAYHELTGLSLKETGAESMDRLWLRGGFPDSFLAEMEAVSQQWRENFISTYLQRDLSIMGYEIRLPSMTVRRLWQMLAGLQGQPVRQSLLATNLDLSRQSIRRILDILQETFMVRQLSPYHANLKKRLVKAPKMYLRDSGVLHTLLGIRSMEELLAHPIVGMSWEGFCIEQVLGQMPAGWDAYFYRTQAQAEVDLVVRRGLEEPPILVEFKHSQAPKVTVGFWSVQKDLQPRASYVIYPGTREYPLSKSVEVIPLTRIGRIWE
ncbi:MAG: ATP-binding protein [Phycisphaerae bacterium]|nr:ATP-binding protein [Phycisphaerae bacterium]